ncbi:MAG TPA: S49 family peptidase [Candidatus Cloacimonadota bacterium]|nr:S49 family peptidase [Candidatus Cloacimonadota bacterium]
MKYFLLLAFALSLSFMFAQSPSDYPHHFNYGDAPVAATDDYLSPMVNPAAMGRGNSGGISFMQLYMDKKYQNPYTVFLNMDNLAYVIQKENNHLNYHTLATGGKVVLGQTIPNLYLGMGYDWRNEYIKKGDIRSSLLWAPHNALSLGFVLTNPFQKAPVYRIGAGVRPLFLGGKVSNRFEMTADMNYAMKTDGDRGLLKPILGVNSEVIDGLKLGGSYNMESKTYGITFSLYNGKSAVGTRAHIKNTDENPGDVNYMYDYVTASDKMFRSILNGKDKAGYYEMPIKQSIVDEKKGMKIGPFFIVDGKQTAMYDLLKKVKQMEEEPTVGGIVFRNINFAASFAHREELIDALKEFKSKGKTIVFYFDNISNGNYAFAAAVGDKIYMNPLGTIDLRGIALNNPYFKELADTLGVDFISYQSHKYKSAFNMFTEKQMTPEERIALSSFLDDLYKEYVNMIQSGRGDKLHKPVQQVIDEGPYFDPDQCLELGLVDQLIYEDQLTDVLKKDMSLKHKITKIEPKYQYDWSEKPKTNVALIYATGNILMGKSAPGKTIGSKTLSELIAKARKQPDIKGIILRVDSGGGSAQASDIIANEVKLCNTG